MVGVAGRCWKETPTSLWWGRVTSACFSPRLEKNIGFAMVPIEYVEHGTEPVVETPHGRQRAVVVRRRFVDPQKEIPKTDPKKTLSRG